jgi:peptidyl-prolyl cis-trans isomerase B (cyclophilin B)
MIKLETNFGDITIELNSEKAPLSSANFLQYVNKGFYDGTIFHRVIEGFMVQGGGFTPDMKQKTTEKAIQNEADNGLKNLRGTLAMARTSDPHSATGQFFINTVDNSFLDHRSKTSDGWGYCVFGKVIEGLDVLDKIRAVKTGNRGGHQDVPLNDVVIEKASVIVE